MYVAALAEYLSSRLGYVVPPGTLMETNGNSQALDMVVAHCTQPGDLVLVEDPTYHLAHQILRDRHVELVPVPQTTEEEEGGEGGHGTAADIAPSSSSSGGVGAATPSAPSLTYGGVSVDALEQLFVQRPELDRSRRQRPLLLYLVPTFNNPTGRCLSLRNRRRLVRLARHQNILLVADDVYQLLHYSPTAPPPPPLRQVALQEGAGDCVVSLGTFSKLLAPGLRLGWIEGPEPLVEVRIARSYKGGVANNTFPLHLKPSNSQSPPETQQLRHHLERRRPQPVYGHAGDTHAGLRGGGRAD